MELKKLVESIATLLVDSPEDVNVTQVNGETIIVLELRVAKSDLGKVIGKNGQTAHSMRILLSGIAMKNHKKVVLEIIE